MRVHRPTDTLPNAASTTKNGTALDLANALTDKGARLPTANCCCRSRLSLPTMVPDTKTITYSIESATDSAFTSPVSRRCLVHRPDRSRQRRRGGKQFPHETAERLRAVRPGQGRQWRECDRLLDALDETGTPLLTDGEAMSSPVARAIMAAQRAVARVGHGESVLYCRGDNRIGLVAVPRQPSTWSTKATE